MKRISIIVLCLTIFALNGTSKTRKLVFVIADGIPYEQLIRLPMTQLHEISMTGGLRPAYVGGENGAYSESPTISAVGYNDLLTGTWANKHNVWDNSISNPNYHYYNIFRFFSATNPKGSTAVFSSWLDNRTKLVGSAASKAGYLQPDFHYDGLESDTVRFPNDSKGFRFQHIDDAIIDSAAATIRINGPDLTWIYLENTDEVGHKYGFGKEFSQAVEIVDDQVGRIWKALKYRENKYDEEWAIIVTSDHGRNRNGLYHSWQTPGERSIWIATNLSGLNAHFTHETPSIVDILPTIATFLSIDIPWKQAIELDGVSIIGQLSGTEARALIQNDSIAVRWNVLNETGEAKILVSTSDNFRTGGEDRYLQVDGMPVTNGFAKFSIKLLPSDFYKIVIEMPYNRLNRWIVKEHCNPHQ